jgi:peptidoglycan-associated lipoprotein
LKTLHLLLAVVIIALLFGCAPKHVGTPLSERVPQAVSEGTETQAPTDAQRDGAVSEEELFRRSEEARRRAAAEAAAEAEKKAKQAGLPKDIYFDFDSYTLKPEASSILKELAQLLNQARATRIVLEGHCDERGTTEYNMVLGQKRADAAREYLAASGVAQNRMKAISYGKENPADMGHTEDAWAKNRRVRIASQ